MTADTSPVNHRDFGTAGPGVLLCHAWWGVSPGMETLAQAIADQGFVVTIPDLYAGELASTVEDAEALMGRISRDERQPRFDAAVEHLLARPDRTSGPIGTVGLSMGSGYALGLAAARPDDVEAVVLYYGLADERPYQRDSFAVLAHLVEGDEWEPDEYIPQMTSGFDEAAIPYTVHTYSGVRHWFAESDVASSWDAAAAGLALDRTVAFLRERLGSAD